MIEYDSDYLDLTDCGSLPSSPDTIFTDTSEESYFSNEKDQDNEMFDFEMNTDLGLDLLSEPPSEYLQNFSIPAAMEVPSLPAKYDSLIKNEEIPYIKSEPLVANDGKYVAPTPEQIEWQTKCRQRRRSAITRRNKKRALQQQSNSLPCGGSRPLIHKKRTKTEQQKAIHSQKKQERRVKNRESAALSRQKNREKLVQLQELVRQLEQKNKQLTHKVGVLETENHMLKNNFMGYKVQEFTDLKIPTGFKSGIPAVASCLTTESEVLDLQSFVRYLSTFSKYYRFNKCMQSVGKSLNYYNAKCQILSRSNKGVEMTCKRFNPTLAKHIQDSHCNLIMIKMYRRLVSPKSELQTCCLVRNSILGNGCNFHSKLMIGLYRCILSFLNICSFIIPSSFHSNKFADFDFTEV